MFKFFGALFLIFVTITFFMGMSLQDIDFGTKEFYTYSVIFIGFVLAILAAKFMLIYAVAFIVDAMSNLFSGEEEKKLNETFSLQDFISNHGFLIYFIVATIVVILIAVYSDGSGPYTGSGGDDYIWKPGRR
ncbi:hypothetical protein N9Y91_05665 [Alphaproteobacteria bacterium]|nr:hypothetical protein [Alphaproteobacteria bacterium]